MNVDLFDFLLLALASFRLTRLFVFDKITEFIRAPFFDEVREENEEGTMEIYYVPKETPMRKFIGELLSCYWCTGVWMSVFVVAGYLWLPIIFVPIILILAVAGIAAILETLIQLWL
ncbi:DUF1360 domain-containing protein [Neobacillus vireti]|uniref:DUF1360 domain-containing protein n=1 Tax=Neobacillus vireti TaxID=220686 RepID=UPI002FFE999A